MQQSAPEPRLDERIAEGAERVQDALVAAGACAWWWDAAADAVGYSPGAPDLLGGAPATLAGLDALVLTDDRAARSLARTRALVRGEPWVCTFRTSAPGAVRWIEERGRAFVDAAGRPVSAVALALDVTRRRGAEQSLEQRLEREIHDRGSLEAALGALADGEAFLESIFAGMVDGLVLYEPDGRVARMNPAARDMLGSHADGADVDALLAGGRVTDVEGRPVPRDRLPDVAALRGESVRGVPLGFQRADGRKAWATVGAAPIRAPDGSIRGAVLTLGDVSRLHDLQEQREDLSRMISHDLRAPLGVILGHAKLLGRRAESADALHARAAAILTSAQRMASMLDDLVESALVEAGKLRLNRAPLDVVHLVTEVRGRLPSPLDPERVRVYPVDGIPHVLGDAERLERVVVNLLTNALKYSAPGSEVAVRFASELGTVTIDVEDHGSGIAPEDVPHLFERYFRSSRAFRFEGMGLGLYTAKMLAEAHGGTIEVTSVAGQGSVFRVRLPAHRADV